MAYIEINDVSKVYQRVGEPFHALSHVSLEIERGEFICLLGPSGCGKTTLLNTLAGFEHPDEGQVLIGGEKVKDPVPNRVTIFQHYGLLPWQTVEKNVMLGLLAKKIPKEQARAAAAKYIDLVGLRVLSMCALRSFPVACSSVCPLHVGWRCSPMCSSWTSLLRRSMPLPV